MKRPWLMIRFADQVLRAHPLGGMAVMQVWKVDIREATSEKMSMGHFATDAPASSLCHTHVPTADMMIPPQVRS
jgi:calcineurin-like phosphoesterase